MRSEVSSDKALTMIRYIMLKENCSFYEAIRIIEELDKKQLIDVYLDDIGYKEN